MVSLDLDVRMAVYAKPPLSLFWTKRTNPLACKSRASSMTDLDARLSL